MHFFRCAGLLLSKTCFFVPGVRVMCNKWMHWRDYTWLTPAGQRETGVGIEYTLLVVVPFDIIPVITCVLLLSNYQPMQFMLGAGGKHQNYSNPSCNPISLQCTPGKSYFPVGWFGDFSGKKGDDSSKVASASAAGAAKAKPSLRRRRPRSRSRMKLPMRSLDDDDISKRFTLEKAHFAQHFYFFTLANAKCSFRY